MSEVLKAPGTSPNFITDTQKRIVGPMMKICLGTDDKCKDTSIWDTNQKKRSQKEHQLYMEAMFRHFKYFDGTQSYAEIVDQYETWGKLLTDGKDI